VVVRNELTHSVHALKVITKFDHKELKHSITNHLSLQEIGMHICKVLFCGHPFIKDDTETPIFGKCSLLLRIQIIESSKGPS
jgi:hypothetical protein